MPPAFSQGSRRTSMQPPAAAAVFARIVHPGERIEHLEKVMKAGTSMRSAALAAQLRHQRDQHRSRPPAPARPAAQLVRLVDDVGVGEEEIFRRRRRASAASTPCFSAHSFPVQPAGSGRPETTCSRSAAASAAPRRARPRAVPSRLWSSTTMTRNRPDSPAQQRSHRVADTFGLVAGRDHGHDRRPRPLGRRVPSSRSRPSQNSAAPSSRYSQIASTIDAMSPFVTDSPCSGDRLHRRRGPGTRSLLNAKAFSKSWSRHRPADSYRDIEPDRHIRDAG